MWNLKYEINEPVLKKKQNRNRITEQIGGCQGREGWGKGRVEGWG